MTLKKTFTIFSLQLMLKIAFIRKKTQTMTVFMTQKIRMANKNSFLIEVCVPAGYK